MMTKTKTRTCSAHRLLLRPMGDVGHGTDASPSSLLSSMAARRVPRPESATRDAASAQPHMKLQLANGVRGPSRSVSNGCDSAAALTLPQWLCRNNFSFRYRCDVTISPNSIALCIVIFFVF